MSCTEKGPTGHLYEVKMDTPLKKIASLSCDGLPSHLLQLSLNTEQEPPVQSGYSRLVAAPGIIGGIATGFPLSVSSLLPHTHALWTQVHNVRWMA